MRAALKRCTTVVTIGIALLAMSFAPRAQTPPARTVSFTRDVAPIVQKSCQTCHRPGSIGPFSLLTYEEARPWARSIKDRVSRRQMPPWHVDKTVGIRRFKDDPSLTDAEIQTIVDWVDGGAPKGSPADMPPPRAFDDSDRWHIGKPDLVVSMPQAFTVKPEQADWWGNFYADSGLTEDRYIKAVEAKPSPGAARVVHHAVQTLVYDEGTDPGGVLVEYAVGKNGDVFPDGAGKLMKAGAKVRFNMHYHAIGQPVTDRTSVGIVFYPKGYTPKHVIRTILSPNQDDLDIPAGESDVRSDAYYKMERNARLIGFMPHMHNRGKKQCLEAIYPDMHVEQLNCVNYDFNWQIVYNYADDAAPLLPAGTIMHVISWHDNSVANKYNPDPRNWVGFGNRTTDDMSRHWLTFYYMSDEEFKAEVAERNREKGTR
ncbi:MAG TPA: cytochrome c [Vicinamibacterales bacterium]|nr:cytochrome c [Vicinamibacterales bacterium]